MADTDILTLSEGKAALNMTGGQTDQDAEIATFISTVSTRIDEIAGAVVKRTLTDEVHSGGNGFINLDYRPVVSITTVKEYRYTTLYTLTAESNASKALDQYVVDRRWGILRRRDSGSPSAFYEGYDNVLVTYVAGRYDTTALVGPKYKQAAAIFLRHLWIREQGAGSVTFGAGDLDSPIPTFGVPNAVRDLLHNDLSVTVA